jgi:hypothetical protein
MAAGVCFGSGLTGRHDECRDGQPDERDEDDRHSELVVVDVVRIEDCLRIVSAGRPGAN